MKIRELEMLIREGRGALPYQAIETLKSAHFIQGSQLSAGPASLDLVLSNECYEIDDILMPEDGEEIFKMMKGELGAKRHKNNILFPGKIYMIAIQETFSLPYEIYGYTNPKSTTGRAFTHCRMLADGVREYDHLPRGWNGKIWMQVIPKVFPISYIPGKDSLNQMRMMIRNAQLSQLELQSLQRHSFVMKESDGTPMLYDRFRIRGGEKGYMILTLDCVGSNGIVGYKALRCKEPLPIGGIHCADSAKYFEPIEVQKRLKLVKNEHYLLSTKDINSIPPKYAAEVQAIGVQYGDNRVHMAGFIDNGFGYDPLNHRFGNTITLEVLANENMSFRHGQPVANLLFEEMAQIPTKLYGETSGNYKTQIGTRLPKQFKVE